jgi:hypothetical protein
MKPSLIYRLSPIALVVLSTIGFNGCDPNEAPDPCRLKVPYTGDFTIYENVVDSLVETDTALRYNYITFRAPDNYDSYEWTIGFDPRTFTEKEVKLLFTEAEGKVDVTLKSTKGQDPCFPNDPVEATVTKSFYVVEWQYAPIIGDYAGYFESTPNIKDTVRVTYTPGVDEFGRISLVNINKGCMVDPEFPESSVWDDVGRGGKAIYFNSVGSFYNGCKAPRAWLRLVEDDGLIADFSFLDRKDINQNPPYPRVEDKFFGKRINH